MNAQTPSFVASAVAREPGASTIARDCLVSSVSRAERTYMLLACGVIAGPVFLVVAIVQALTRPGYDLARHPISMLSLGDLGWIQSANFIASGVLMLAFAVGLRRLLRGGRGGTWGGALIGVFGAGLIVAGVFVPDPAWGFPLGAPDGIPSQLSWHAALHGVGFTLAFVGVSLACLVFARRSLARGERILAAYAVCSALIALVLSGWPGTDGASVRYFVAAAIVWAWTVVLAVRLRRHVA